MTRAAELDGIVMIALVAILCGAESCVDMALFGRSEEPLLRRFLRLPGGVRSHDTAIPVRTDLWELPR